MADTRHHPPAHSVNAAISNAVVRLLADYTSRGPTKARTHVSEDFIAVVVQDTFTNAFLSDNHADPDVAVECFVLTPQDGATSMAN
ncbi:MAG TPA: Na-translocating system protein MpsC family protein [Conexibacter sp.]|jgi:uncharacterized protein YbcI|nr:Na-translocating system protein MpsC family protein [Conexibacter sp.]